VCFLTEYVEALKVTCNAVCGFVLIAALIVLQTSLEKTENEILELSQNSVNLKSNFLELTELTHVLEKTETFFSEREDRSGRDSLTHALISEDPAQTTTVRGRLGSV
jgi:V-type H+-transporting ATPase subunit a